VKLAARPDASVSRVDSSSRRKKRSVLALRCDAGGLVSPPDSGSVREWIETNVDGAGAVTNVQQVCRPLFERESKPFNPNRP
jgi:hypothetical protein